MGQGCGQRTFSYEATAKMLATTMSAGPLSQRRCLQHVVTLSLHICYQKVSGSKVNVCTRGVPVADDCFIRWLCKHTHTNRERERERKREFYEGHSVLFHSGGSAKRGWPMSPLHLQHKPIQKQIASDEQRSVIEV